MARSIVKIELSSDKRRGTVILADRHNICHSHGMTAPRCAILTSCLRLALFLSSLCRADGHVFWGATVIFVIGHQLVKAAATASACWRAAATRVSTESIHQTVLLHWHAPPLPAITFVNLMKSALNFQGSLTFSNYTEKKQTYREFDPRCIDYFRSCHYLCRW